MIEGETCQHLDNANNFYQQVNPIDGSPEVVTELVHEIIKFEFEPSIQDLASNVNKIREFEQTTEKGSEIENLKTYVTMEFEYVNQQEYENVNNGRDKSQHSDQGSYLNQLKSEFDPSQIKSSTDEKDPAKSSSSSAPKRKHISDVHECSNCGNFKTFKKFELAFHYLQCCGAKKSRRVPPSN